MRIHRHLRLALLLATVPVAFLVLAFAVYGGKRAVDRYIQRMPENQAANWRQLLESRKADLAGTTWKDTRPLMILAGDSHIEMGRWYEAFQGSLAIRNCGLSGSKIADVTALVAKISDPEIHTILLHCGINDMLAGASPEDCIGNYVHLLDQAKAHGPRRIVVTAVMPVRRSPVDGWSPDINQNVMRFNGLLESECLKRGVAFLNPVNAVAGSGGGLRDEFTFDGLHLNSRGYAALAALILQALTSAS